MFELNFEISDDDLGGKFDDSQIDAAIRFYLNDIADWARYALIKNAPIDSGSLVDHISEGRVNKTGDFWTVSIGIEPIPPKHVGESPEYPKFVDEGTGIFGPEGFASGGGDSNHFSPLHGNVLAFEKASGETVFTRWVTGQVGQHFMDRTENEVNAHIEVSKHELAAIISSMLG